MFFGLVRPSPKPRRRRGTAAPSGTSAAGPRSRPSRLPPPVPGGDARFRRPGPRPDLLRVGDEHVRCRIARRSRAELVAVSAPSALRGVDSKHLDRVIIDGPAARRRALPGRRPRCGDRPVRVPRELPGRPLPRLPRRRRDRGQRVPADGRRRWRATALLPSVRKGLDHLFGATTGARARGGPRAHVGRRRSPATTRWSAGARAARRVPRRPGWQAARTPTAPRSGTRTWCSGSTRGRAAQLAGRSRTSPPRTARSRRRR